MAWSSMRILALLTLTVGLVVANDGETLTFSAASTDNIAYHHKTQQSSTYSDHCDRIAESHLAVDGNMDVDLDSHHCSHTLMDHNPWWSVDLGLIRNVGRVVITNRGDCCAGRLSMLRIGTTNLNPLVVVPVLGEFELCASVDGAFGSGETRSIRCLTVGRFLVIMLEREGFLTLCEVQVFEVNIARHHTTQQSTNLEDGRGLSSLAVDGNDDVDYESSNSCTQTTDTQNPWWSVDFGSIRNMSRVVITNRGDCCADRLSMLRIGTTDVDPMGVSTVLGGLELCASTDQALGEGETRSIQCVASGRFLVIMLERKGILTLCEVQVFEDDMEDTYRSVRQGSYNIAYHQKTKQSSDFDLGKESQSHLAVDGNDDGMYRTSRSCTRTTKSLNPWWSVDFGQIRNVATVVITTRSDCCAFQLKSLRIYLANDEPSMRPYTRYQCAYVTNHLVLGETRRIQCIGSARFLVIELQATGYLTLCEVKVFEGFEDQNDVGEALQQTNSMNTNYAISGGIVGAVAIIVVLACIAQRYSNKRVKLLEADASHVDITTK